MTCTQQEYDVDPYSAAVVDIMAATTLQDVERAWGLAEGNNGAMSQREYAILANTCIGVETVQRAKDTLVDLDPHITV